jgi:hypothetical protein
MREEGKSMGRSKRADALGNKIKERSYNPYTRGMLEQLLPSVGEHLTRPPSALNGDLRKNLIRRRCVVVQVNREALWYRVKWLNAGYYECFKVPEV